VGVELSPDLSPASLEGVKRSLSAIRRAGGYRNEDARRFWSWLPSVG
jgi:hypothetical protein